MSHTIATRRIYVDTNTTPHTGISIADVKAILGIPSNDLGTLCRSGNIRKFAKNKPVRHSSIAALTDAQRKAVDYGLVAYNGHALLYTGSSAQQDVFTAAINSKYKWDYQKPRGIANTALNPTADNEWFRMLDFNEYNGFAEYPPLIVTFTPDANNRAKAKISFVHPTGNGADLAIRHFSWYTAVQTNIDNPPYHVNWKHAVLLSPSWNGAIQRSVFYGPDVYKQIPGGEDYNDVGISETGNEWTHITNGFETEITVERGKRTYFVPVVTRSYTSGGGEDGWVYIPTDASDVYSLPQSVTTAHLTKIQFEEQPSIAQNTNWADLSEYGGTLQVGAHISGIILQYDNQEDCIVDIRFYLCSVTGGNEKVTAFDAREFYAQNLNQSNDNYYDGDPGHDSKLSFTIDNSGGRFLTTGSKLYLQVTEKDSGTLLDEIYIQDVPNFNI